MRPCRNSKPGRPALQHINILAPPDLPDEVPYILERLRHGRPVDHFHTHRKHKDGSIVHVSLTISPIRNEAGEIVAASKISRDISGLRETARMRALMEDNNRLLRELSHGVGNNLSIVLSALRQEAKRASPEHRSGFDAAIERVFQLAAEHEERMAARSADDMGAR